MPVLPVARVLLRIQLDPEEAELQFHVEDVPVLPIFSELAWHATDLAGRVVGWRARWLMTKSFASLG
jgi:hypothetical protein